MKLLPFPWEDEGDGGGGKEGTDLDDTEDITEEYSLTIVRSRST